MNIIDFESGKDCYERMKKGIYDIITYKSDDDGKTVDILITHRGPLDLLNSYFNYPGLVCWDNTKCCYSFIYKVDKSNEENMKFEFELFDCFYPEQ